MMTLSNCS